MKSSPIDPSINFDAYNHVQRVPMGGFILLSESVLLRVVTIVLSKLSLQPRKVIPTKIRRIIFFKGTSSLDIAKVN